MRVPGLIPLFALPNVVLFPCAVLPLHIFEDRYKKMLADVLGGHRKIAMALLKPGWEKDYYGRPPIEPVVCLGTILSHERLSDGRHNILLQGQARARVVWEVGKQPYRQAELELLEEEDSAESDLELARKCLASMVALDAFSALPGASQIRELLASDLPTGMVADLLAFRLLPDDRVEFKQLLLAESNVKSRVWRIVEAVALMRPAWRNVPQDAGLN